jgi:hypothetical protein
MASPAGRESHYPITGTSAISEFLDTFSKISAPVVRTCDIALSSMTPPSPVTVFVDCQQIYETSPDAGTSGWYIDYGQSPPHLIFAGSGCQDIENFGAREMDIFGSCPDAHP